MKYSLIPWEFPRAKPLGTLLVTGNSSPYIPTLVIIQIHYMLHIFIMSLTPDLGLPSRFLPTPEVREHTGKTVTSDPARAPGLVGEPKEG